MNARAHLLPITSYPFHAHPELLDIWPHRRAEIQRDMIDCLAHPDEERAFLIMVDGHPVGITGFYRYDDQVGLNWHGVLPAFAGFGLGRWALDQVADLAETHYPDAQYLVEELPAAREPELRGFFTKAGFTRTDITVDKPWITADTEWIEYRRPLRETDTAVEPAPRERER